MYFQTTPPKTENISPHLNAEKKSGDIKICAAVLRSGMTRCESPKDKKMCELWEGEEGEFCFFYMKDWGPGELCSNCLAQFWAHGKARK